MQIAGIEANDFINGEGISVSVWMQGCPFHCKGCHNPETWDKEGGIYINPIDLMLEVKELLIRNGIQRNLSILGGEPLWESNLIVTSAILKSVRKKFPNIKIFLWTGYLYEDLLQNDFIRKKVLPLIDVLIDGPFKIEERDVTLHLCGSRNQRVIDVQKSLIEKEVKLYKA